MAERVEEIVGQIRQTGGRVTRSRRMVIERIIERGDHHATAPDLLEDLRRVDPDFHESTVYRVLERLTDLGVVKPVQVQPGRTVFHVTPPGHLHHHLLCEACGTVTEIDGQILGSLGEQIERQYDFVARVDTPITFHGTCKGCRRAEPAHG